MILRYTRYTTKKNLLLLKDLLDLQRLRCTNTWLQYEKIYINKLNDLVDEYNNTYQRTIKMKSVDVKDNAYINSMELHSSKEVNDKDPKVKLVIT